MVNVCVCQETMRQLSCSAAEYQKNPRKESQKSPQNSVQYSAQASYSFLPPRRHFCPSLHPPPTANVHFTPPLSECSHLVANLKDNTNGGKEAWLGWESLGTDGGWNPEKGRVGEGRRSRERFHIIIQKEQLEPLPSRSESSVFISPGTGSSLYVVCYNQELKKTILLKCQWLCAKQTLASCKVMQRMEGPFIYTHIHTGQSPKIYSVKSSSGFTKEK